MQIPVKKPYLAHEIVYQQMFKQGIRSWDLRDRKRRAEIEVNDKKFLISILRQPWAPKKGKVLELGCGTGPILRLVCKQGFTGYGIDISNTAITMAKQQAKGLNIKYTVGDICRNIPAKPASIDIIIDGHCLHCITDTHDRKQAITNIYRLLKPGGCFIGMTMCEPIDRKAFEQECPGQKLVDGIIYNPWNKAAAYTGMKIISGKKYIPTRYLGDWKELLAEFETAGFHLQLAHYAYPVQKKDICSMVYFAALKLNN
ncbi:MAG: class I SAM-dependent methyltransferase [bacterium]